MADPWVRPTSPGPPDPGVPSPSEDEARAQLERTPGPDDYLLIDRLREDATSGRMDLSSILSEATHAARYFTDATGAALALWSQGVVICRARSGDTAPPLGAKLDVDSGISGECLRSGRSQRCHDSETDPRVDAELCREMGIRSLAAVPIRGGQGVIGILETFSDKPNAFSDAHITLLKKLAKIAATGREQSATVPVRSIAQVPTQSPVTPAPEVPPKPESPHPWATRDWFAFLPARMQGEEGQPLRLAAAAALLLLLAVFGWALSRSRGNRNDSGNAANATVPSVMAAGKSSEAAKTDASADSGSGKTVSTINLSPVSKPSGDAVAKDLVQRASRSTVTERESSITVKDELPAPAAAKAPPTTVAEAEVAAPDPSEALSAMKGAAAVPQAIANPQPIFPFVALPVSQGVTGGRLSRKIDPIYPSEARVQRLEGAVMLDALVGEDGNVREVAVTSGPPLLAKAAVQAVKQWRYQPFLLNGKPVSIHNQITIQFKLP
jgi:TonB family protein